MTFRTVKDLCLNLKKPPLPSEIQGYAPVPRQGNNLNITFDTHNEKSNVFRVYACIMRTLDIKKGPDQILLPLGNLVILVSWFVLLKISVIVITK